MNQLRLRWPRKRNPKPPSPDDLRKRAAGELRKNRPQRAIPHLETALETESASFETRINLGTAYYLTGQYEKAVPHLRYVLALEEHHPTALLNLAACLDALGQVEQSIQTLEKLLASRPSWKDGHYNLAIAHLKNDDKKSAEAALKKELEQNPQHRAARDLLNRVYITTTDAAGAAKEEAKDATTDD